MLQLPLLVYPCIDGPGMQCPENQIVLHNLYSLTVRLALTILCVLLQTSGNAKAAQGAIRENLGKVLGSDEQQGKGAQHGSLSAWH